MQDVFYDWFDDEWAPKPVSTTTPAHRAERRIARQPAGGDRQRR
jgi:hypothetical protein